MPVIQDIRCEAVLKYRPASAGITQFEDLVTTGRFGILGNPEGYKFEKLFFICALSHVMHREYKWSNANYLD
jgi:hypothetical protein